MNPVVLTAILTVLEEVVSLLRAVLVKPAQAPVAPDHGNITDAQIDQLIKEAKDLKPQ